MKKTIYNIAAIIISALVLFSCEFDNYDEPGTSFKGVLKNGDTSLNTRHGVIFKLYQYREDGYISAGSQSIDVYINQNGEYSALLFPGRYKMVVNTEGGVNHAYDWNDFPRNESGNLDTLYFNLNGDKTLDFNVTPYFEINDFRAVYRNDSIISGFTIKKLTDITTTSIVGFRNVSMYLSPTIHVNNDTPLSFPKTASQVTVDTPIEIAGSLKNYYTSTNYKNNYRDYVYVRIAISLRVSGQEFIYSPIIKVEGIPQETIYKFK
jgi:hypothetical protein